MKFDDLGLSAPLLKAIKKQGYENPSPIQQKAIPAILDGRDVMAAAQTGTGKTAGFSLPILQRLASGRRARPNQARALILTPTRELAAQVGESVREYGLHTDLTSAVVFGGVKINPQMMKLRKGVDVLVGPEVMGFDVMPVACFSNAGLVNHAFDKRLQVGIIDNPAEIALEMNHVDQIKSGQRREQADIGFRQHSFSITDQPRSPIEMQFQFIQAFKQRRHRFIVGLLTSSKT